MCVKSKVNVDSFMYISLNFRNGTYFNPKHDRVSSLLTK